MTTETHEKTSSNEIIEPIRANKYLLSDDTFKLLCEAQQRIFDETEMKPSLRKLINTIITKEIIYETEKTLIEALA